MMRNPSRVMLVLAIGLALAIPADSFAHWCSNIYQTYTRIVVKPDRQNINVADGTTGELKVRVRNNFPYTLHYVLMRANPPPELEVTITPNETDAQDIRVYPGQEVTFTLSITRNGPGSDDVADLGLEVRPRVERIDSWRDMGNWWVDQDPDPADVRNSIQNHTDQTYALLHGDLADLDSCASCETEGVNGLINLWSDRVDNCTTGNLDSVWPQIFMRSGHQLAVRLRFRTFNDPDRSTVVQTMIYGMDNPYPIARGLAAFYAAYGGSDTGVQARVQQMADTDSDGGNCTYSADADTQNMAKAGLLMMGENQYHTEVTNCVGDSGFDVKARAACAAALGIMGEDDPVINYLMSHVTNGANCYDVPASTAYANLIGCYLMHLVVLVRRGGPEGVGPVSFLDEEVIEDNTAPAAPTGLTVQPL